MLNAYTVSTGSIYSENACAKSDVIEKSVKFPKIGADFNPWYSNRLFLSAGNVCFRD